MGNALRTPPTTSPKLLPPVTRVDTPLEHISALWPGLLDGSPFGSKSILRARTADEWDREGRAGREQLVRRLQCATSNGEATGRGEFKDDLLYIRTSGSAEEKSADLAEVVGYLERLQGKSDKYVSLNTFFGRRRHDNLKCLTALAVDLDLKAAQSKGKDYGSDFMRLRQDALDILSSAGIQTPNFAVHTGRGIHLYWLFDRILPAAAFTRWRACLKELIRLLANVGADEAVKDSARVLRLAGTINSSAPIYCNRVTTEVFKPARYSFDFLCDQILPFTREQLQEQRASRAARIVELGPRQARHGVVVRPGGTQETKPGRRFSATAVNRLADLDLLAKVRYPNGVEEGKRNKYLFAAACQLAWICRPQTLETEVLAWKEKHTPSLSDQQALSTMSTVINRAQVAYQDISSGIYKSVFDDERYVISSAELWSRFGDDIEVAGLVDQMKGILPNGVLKERQKAARKAQNADNYTGKGLRTSNIPKAIEARRLKEEGATMRTIAAQLNVSPKTISAWLALESEALGLVAKPCADAKTPAKSYPQGASKCPVLPKSTLKNGEAKQSDSFSSLMAPALGGARGGAPEISTLNSATKPVATPPAPVLQSTPPTPRLQLVIESSSRPEETINQDQAPPMRPRASYWRYPKEQLDALRILGAPAILDLLGIHFKDDASYRPKTSSYTRRLHLTLPSGGVIELLHDGLWPPVRICINSAGVNVRFLLTPSSSKDRL